MSNLKTQERIKTYPEFYQFYLTEHRNSSSRKLHFFGTALVFVWLLTYLKTGNGYYLIAAPLSGYFFAWIGHFFFEKNKPATFKYPLWSLISDFKLFFDILRGKEKLNPLS